MTTASPAAADRPPARRRVPAWAGLGVALAVFAAIAPALGWLELSNGIEQLHAATVLEVRRTGNWLVPTLNGRERIKKPPLPAWTSAAAVSDRTLTLVSSPQKTDRDAGFARLQWETRWPIALAGCLMLAAVFDLGATLANRRVGLAAAVVAGTSLLFLRYVRLGSTDVPLALFVALANALLARAVFRRQFWLGVVGTGAALGLAFMCKGPVALLQTLVPLGIWAAITWWAARRRRATRIAREPRGSAPGPVDAPRADAPSVRTLALPLVLSVVAFLAIVLPWPLLVLSTRPDAAAQWWAEITREGATDHEYGPIYSYLSLVPNLLPWLPAIAVGLWMTVRRRQRTVSTEGEPTIEVPASPPPALSYQRAEKPPAPVAQRRAIRPGYLLALCWLAVPVLVMSLVRDKHERYLLPLLPAAAVLAGRGLVALSARRPALNGLFALQLGLVAAGAVALPAIGLVPKIAARADGSALYPPVLGAAAIAVAVAATAGMFALLRRRPSAAVAVAAVVVLGLNGLGLRGYAGTRAGQSEMRPIAERILAAHPDAVVGYYDPRKDPKPMPPDIAIFLNRAVEQIDADFTTRRTDRPADVLVMLQREGEKPPAVPGWRSFAAEPYGKRFWHAMEREPATK